MKITKQRVFAAFDQNKGGITPGDVAKILNTTFEEIKPYVIALIKEGPEQIFLISEDKEAPFERQKFSTSPAPISPERPRPRRD